MLCVAFDFPGLSQAKKQMQFIQEVSNFLVQGSWVCAFRIQKTAKLHQSVGSIGCKRQKQKLVRRDVGQPCSGPVSVISHASNPVKQAEKNLQMKQDSAQGFCITCKAMFRCRQASHLRNTRLLQHSFFKPTRKNVGVEDLLRWGGAEPNGVVEDFLPTLTTTTTSKKK